MEDLKENWKDYSITVNGDKRILKDIFAVHWGEIKQNGKKYILFDHGGFEMPNAMAIRVDEDNNCYSPSDKGGEEFIGILNR